MRTKNAIDASRADLKCAAKHAPRPVYEEKRASVRTSDKSNAKSLFLVPSDGGIQPRRIAHLWSRTVITTKHSVNTTSQLNSDPATAAAA